MGITPMMSERRSQAAVVWVGWLLVTLFLSLGPPALFRSIQTLFQSATSRVLSLAPASPSVDSPSTTHSPDSPEPLLVENRELRRQLADLKARHVIQQEHDRLPLQPDQELIRSRSIPARILGRKGDPLSANLQLLLGLGKQHGLLDSELVLAGEGMLIDAGSNQLLSPDQLVTSGQSLLGRTTRVGQQSALVQPLTDSSFRMAVRLYRSSTLGPVQGPAGILVGTGSDCRIEEIAATEAVAPGDDVYTDPVSSPSGVSVYCGRVTKVEVLSTAPHWTIEMRPHIRMKTLPRDVHVLKSDLNLTRSPF